MARPGQGKMYDGRDGRSPERETSCGDEGWAFDVRTYSSDICVPRTSGAER